MQIFGPSEEEHANFQLKILWPPGDLNPWPFCCEVTCLTTASTCTAAERKRGSPCQFPHLFLPLHIRPPFEQRWRERALRPWASGSHWCSPKNCWRRTTAEDQDSDTKNQEGGGLKAVSWTVPVWRGLTMPLSVCCTWGFWLLCRTDLSSSGYLVILWCGLACMSPSRILWLWGWVSTHWTCNRGRSYEQ